MIRTTSLLTTLALMAPTAAVLAAEAPPPGVAAMFEAHETALNAHDLDGLMALYAPGADTVMMGTLPEERWVGHDQIRAAYEYFFKDFDAGSVQRDCPWSVHDTDGTLAWIAAQCNYQDTLGDEQRTFALNISAVLQQLDGAWTLRSMHFSNATLPSMPSEHAND